MRDRDKVQVIRAELDRLRPTLSGFVRNHNAVARMLCAEAPPLDSDEEYDGVKLVDLMVPEPRGGDSEVAELFSKLVFERLAPEMLDAAPSWAAVGSRVESFVAGKLERFILWVSRRPGCHLVTGPDTLMVEGALRLGVLDGVPQCLHNEYLTKTLNVAPLSDPLPFRTRDQGFIVLYGRADPAARRFLAAARLAYPYGFENLAPWAYGRVERNLRDDVTKVLTGSDDPLSRLYDMLVPQVMRKRTFYRTLGGPKQWGGNPSEAARERWYVKLVSLGVI